MRDDAAALDGGWAHILPSERTRLVRLCARLTGDADAAEDLAQETLIEAWRLRERLYDPSGRDRWLSAIARNPCLRWCRAKTRQKVIHGPAPGPDGDGASPLDQAADGFDLEAEFEHHDLARLLDRAMADLPARSREMLVARYLEEAPQTEIAARFGLSAGAVGKRLERGRLDVRRVLATTLREEAVSYGLTDGDGQGWRETRIWCLYCGRSKLVGTADLARRRLALRCPVCHEPEVYTARTDRLDVFAGVRGYKPALNRLMTWRHAYYSRARDEGGAACIGCGGWLILPQGMPEDGPLRDVRGVHLRCHRCLPPVDVSLSAVVLWSPEGRRFWRDHPRIRSLPQREIETEGRAAIVVGYEAVTSDARFEVVFARDGYRVLGSHRPSGG